MSERDRRVRSDDPSTVNEALAEIDRLRAQLDRVGTGGAKLYAKNEELREAGYALIDAHSEEDDWDNADARWREVAGERDA